VREFNRIFVLRVATPIAEIYGLPFPREEACAESLKMASACGDGYVHCWACYPMMMMMMMMMMMIPKGPQLASGIGFRNL